MLDHALYEVRLGLNSSGDFLCIAEEISLTAIMIVMKIQLDSLQ